MKKNINPNFGYSNDGQSKTQKRVGWCDVPEKETRSTTPSYLKDLNSNCLVLFDKDKYFAVGRQEELFVLSFQDLKGNQNAVKFKKPKPLIRHKFVTPIQILINKGSKSPNEIFALLKSGELWSVKVEFDNKKKIKARKIATIKDVLFKSIIATKNRLIVWGQSCTDYKHLLLEIDPRACRVIREIPVAFSNPKSIAAIDPEKLDSLILTNSKGETNILTLSEETGDTIPTITQFDVNRVNAAVILNSKYAVVAQKGGVISKVKLNNVISRTTSSNREKLERACRLFCWLNKYCNCKHDCSCTRPDPEKPETPDRSGTIVDDEPCDENHRAKLHWTPNKLFLKTDFVVALSKRNQRMAVLDKNLNLIFERYLGQEGMVVAQGQSNTNVLMMINVGKGLLEGWALDTYRDFTKEVQPELFVPKYRIDPKIKKSITYYGHPNQKGLPNPHLNVAIFTVIEPGQDFNDPDQSLFLSQIESKVFDIVNDYYSEISFEDLDVQFSVFGADLGGNRIPLVLPQAIANYFYDDFTPGGVEAEMPADFANPISLDGSESLAIRTHPRTGSNRDYDIPFAALWINETFGAYPVEVEFDGTETLTLTVEAQTGDTHILNLNFAAFSTTLNQADDENAFLQSIGNYITNTIRTAEAALPGDPVTVQDVVFRRIRTNDNDAQFGILQGQISVAPPAAPADAIQKGNISISNVQAPTPEGIQNLGLDGGGDINGVLDSSAKTSNYFRECLRAAQFDVGEGPGLNDPHFSVNIQVTSDAPSMELAARINLVSAYGGQGATIEVLSHNGHNESGWNASSEIAGSESNSNNQNTMRYSQDIANDTFTAALDHIRATTAWNRDTVQAMFEDFDVMVIGFVGAPPGGLLPAEQWEASDPVDFSRLRMFSRGVIASDQNGPGGEVPVSMPTHNVIGQKFDAFRPGLLAHELGHAIGLPDLYSASGFRDDVLYISSWAMMGGGNENLNHFCGWSKWVKEWIAEDADPDISQIVPVPMPEPDDLLVVEAWLIPIEHWDNSIKTDVRSEVGGTLPIAQLMKVELGSDGGIVNLVELRSEGINYSQNLPANPSVLITNVLQPGTDRRWAVNGLYRRSVHRMNNGNELMNVGDQWDFAAGLEFPVKGTTIEITDIRTIRGGSVPVYRLRIEREQAEFIDLYFQDNVPSYKSPDIWIDWPGDNADPSVHRVYPEGTPTDQGENVRFPETGIEPHYMVARVHNGGNVRAEDVKVKWFICDPPGSGDDGRWVAKDTKIIPVIGPGESETMPFIWNVDSSTSTHQCIRAEIIDWTIPAEVDPTTGDTIHLASDDVKLQNNNAQQNVFDFEVLSASPYDLIEFEFQVHNDFVEAERAALVPETLPYGATLTVSPAEAVIQPNKSYIFKCQLKLDNEIIKPGCSNDQGFLLTAWRRAEDSDENWGSCFYFVRPRYKTQLELKNGFFKGEGIYIQGELKTLAEEAAELPDTSNKVVRVRIVVNSFEGKQTKYWRNAIVQSNGLFTLDATNLPLENPKEALVQAWFDRTNILGSSVSNLLTFRYPIIQ